MTILGNYPEPHTRLPGAPYVDREPLPPEDINNIVDNQRSMWNGVNGMSGTVPDMQSITTAVHLSTIFHVNQFGWYVYSTSLPSSVSAPFGHMVYEATGVGTGYWVLEMFLVLLTGNPAKIKNELLPWPQVVNAFQFGTPSYINQLVNNSSYAQVNDHANNALSISFNGMLQNDLMEFDVGPFEIFAYAGDSVLLRVRLNQGTTDTNYVLQASGGSAGTRTPASFNLQYTSLSTSDVTLYVEAKNGGTLNSAINSPNQPSSEWGPSASGFQWLRHKRFRTFA